MDQKKNRIAVTFSVLIVWCVIGVHQAAAQISASQPVPGSINLEHSRVFSFVEGKGMGHSHGVEAKLKPSRLVLGASVDAGSFVFDMQSFDVDTPRSRQVVGLSGEASRWARKKVNAEMHGPKILNTSRFPTAEFKIDAAVADGVESKSRKPKYILSGTFTLVGQSRKISFPVTAQEEKGWIHIRGKFAFKQSDYGIEPFSKAFGAMGVADTITVTGDLWVAPTPASIASVRKSSTGQLR
ncbi:MAG: YceI family protein [Planctomycetota bacterium]